jgi:hypothetical protein
VRVKVTVGSVIETGDKVGVGKIGTRVLTTINDVAMLKQTLRIAIIAMSFNGDLFAFSVSFMQVPLIDQIVTITLK